MLKRSWLNTLPSMPNSLASLKVSCSSSQCIGAGGGRSPMNGETKMHSMIEERWSSPFGLKR